MPILCLGLNHKTAPLDLRERLAFDEARARTTLSRIGFGRAPDSPIAELVVLSTCNRVEVYAYSPRADFAPLLALLSEASEVGSERIAAHVYTLEGREAVRHMFRVAAGLDSMVLGEQQILGQVAEAHVLALRGGSSGLVLARLFQAAIHAGKRVRHETKIGAKSANVAAVAVHLVTSVAPNLGEAHVLVLGSGEMAELAMGALRKRSVRQITVVNRSVARAQELADRWGASVRPFEALADELARSDVVIASTGALHTVIHLDMVETAMRQRPTRPLVIIDIAVPRDVDERASGVPGVRVYDLDQLNAHVTQSVEQRQAQVPASEAIVEEEIEAFEAWMRSLAIRPLLRDLRAKAEAIRRAEVEKTLRRHNGSGATSLEALEALTCALVSKLLDAPTRALRESSQSGEDGRIAQAARELFALTPETPYLESADR